VTDDLALQAPTAPPPDPIPLDQPEPLAGPHVQITEAAATPFDAGEVIERRDAYGRVPIVVRIRRVPPIRIEWILLAIGLAASGVVLPLIDAIKVVILVAAVGAVFLGFISRIFLRIPPGAAGLVMRGGRHDRVLSDGIHRVSPAQILTHVVSLREFAFDVPVSEVRSSDGVGVTVDLLLTLRIEDPAKFAYTITTGDLDQLTQAETQDAVRRLIRGIPALRALDIGSDEAALLREIVDSKLEAYGVEARAVAFTRVALPDELLASLAARRLAAVQLDEQAQSFELDKRRLSDQATLIAQEAAARRTSVEHEALAEGLRLAKLEERIGANPAAARYDLELARLRVAQALAGNTRAVVSLGNADLATTLLASRDSDTNGGTTPATGPIAATEPDPAAPPKA
jgi:regulator of protease activity HflC (stomatin/prohibitin superfamily)